MRSPLFSAMGRLMLLGRPHWGTLGFALASMTLLAAGTGAFAFLVGPAFEFLLTGGASGLQKLFELTPGLARVERAQLLYVLPALVVLAGAIKGLGYLGQFYWAGLFGQRVVVDLRRQLFEKLLSLTPYVRSRQQSGDLLSRFTADVAAVELAATTTVASWLRDSLVVLTLAAVAAWTSPLLALLALLVVPVAIYPVSRLTAALLRRTREGQHALGRLAAQLQEGLGALSTIQVFNAEEAELTRFRKQTATLARALNRAAWARAGVPGLMEILASVAIAALLAWSLSSGTIATRDLVSFLGALLLMYQPAKDLGRVSQFALTAGAALERIEAVMQLPALAHHGAGTAPPLKREITFEGVSFSWGGRQALDAVSFTIPVGQVTALVGESGSGKSTVASLLLRFEVPTQGLIRFDGVDVAEASVASIRRQFALVTQEPQIFSGTVRDNLLVARPQATETEIESALGVAGAADFVSALPLGLETRLGERGVTLSGGQRQRLCLARAVLARAPVLVLDEATSNLDPQSEREVQAALDRVLQGRTALVIAHRLSSIQKAGQIVVLDSGRVAQVGTHQSLLQRGGRYAELVRASAPK